MSKNAFWGQVYDWSSNVLSYVGGTAAGTKVYTQAIPQWVNQWAQTNPVQASMFLQKFSIGKTIAQNIQGAVSQANIAGGAVSVGISTAINCVNEFVSSRVSGQAFGSSTVFARDMSGTFWVGAGGVGGGMLGAAILGATPPGWVIAGGSLVGFGIYKLHLNWANRQIAQASQPHVGGVLFDKSAEVLTDLEEITGAYWDEAMGQLVLIGKKNGRVEENYLPIMDKDHLAVAMRAVFTNDNLGVSIDQPPGYEGSQGFPPDHTMMPVRYLGNTQDTLFGAIMFEADKLLKNLSMGRDNISGKPVTSQVQDFQSELDLSMYSKSDKSHVWTRMWFVIEEMKLSLEVKETPDRSALIFGKAALKVKAEYLNKEKNPGVNPVAEQFAKHFTLHFDEFAKEYPVLERLKELAKVVAIAKYLKDSGKPIDLSFLDDHEFIKVETPKTTPGIIASKTKQVIGGAHTCFLYGGVDFDFEYRPINDTGEAEILKKSAQGNRPCETALGWEFRSNGGVKKALAVSLAGKNGNYSTACVDISLSVTDTDKLTLGLVRFYNSFNTKPTVFGYGWDLVAYKIFMLHPNNETNKEIKAADNSYREIFLVDKLNHKSYKYTFVKDKKAYFLVKEEKSEGRQTLFTYDPENFITRNSEGVFTWKSAKPHSYNFDPQGRLISTDNHVNYIYQDNRLVRIAGNSGEYISLVYDQQNRIKQAIVYPGQKTIDFLYDIYEDLIKVMDKGKEIIGYAYDSEHHLIKIIDKEGKAAQRNSYDPLGRLIKKRDDVVVDNGNRINRIYDDNCRLVKEEDTQGNVVSYEYDDNNLKKSVVNDKWKRASTFEYNREERVSKVTNPLGRGTRFNYDDIGNLTSIIDAKGHSNTFSYDHNGNPVLFKDALGNEWKRKFDEASRPLTITDPLGRSTNFTYKDDKLVNINTPEGMIHYNYDKKGNLIKISAADGSTMKFTYDSNNNLLRIKDAFGRLTKYNYDSSGRLVSAVDSQGKSVAINNAIKPLP